MISIAFKKSFTNLPFEMWTAVIAQNSEVVSSDMLMVFIPIYAYFCHNSCCRQLFSRFSYLFRRRNICHSKQDYCVDGNLWYLLVGIFVSVSYFDMWLLFSHNWVVICSYVSSFLKLVSDLVTVPFWVFHYMSTLFELFLYPNCL